VEIRLGDYSRLGDYWETTGRLLGLGDYWETTGSLLGDYWETTN